MKGFAWLIGGAGFLAGVLVGLVVKHLTALTVKTELDVSDLISATITLLVAVFIGYILQRRWDTQRWEKEKLIDLLEDLHDQAKTVRRSVQEYSAGKKARTDVNSAIRDLSAAVHVFEKRLGVFEVEDDLMDELEDVKTKLYDYRVFVSEDVYHDPSVVGAHQETEKFNAFTDSLYTLVRAINRL